MPLTDIFLVPSPAPGEKQVGRVSESILWNDSMINPWASLLVKSPLDAGDPGSIHGWEDRPGEGNGNPLQYSCLENSMDTEA